jgi:hypothetical protein
VAARIAIDPPAAARDSDWLTVTAWQGGGLVVDRLRSVGGGVYRTTEPIPVYGQWKADVRLHSGNSLLAMPIYLPNDPAIPAREVPARRHFDRTFLPDKKVLQRESKTTNGLVPLAAYGAVFGLALVLFMMLGWAVDRVAAIEDRPGGRRLSPAGKARGPLPATGRAAAAQR